MRGAAPFLIAGALAACGAPRVVEERAVAVRSRYWAVDSALVLSYPASICSVTLRDETARFHDHRPRRDGTERVDMTRAVPNHPHRRWSSGEIEPLLTVIALPPGRYTLTGYATSDDFDELETPEGPRARTDCEDPTTRSVHFPLRIEPGRLTLLDLPAAKLDFTALRTMASALQNPHVARSVGSWLPELRRTGSARHRELADQQRQRREGYDLYPRCDGKVAIVRRTGTPFAWYERPDDEEARRRFGARARAYAADTTRSTHATGFGRGCVAPLAFIYLLTDPAELEPLARSLGKMMVAEDLAGEIDLVLTGPALEVAEPLTSP
jgi:hypothetical protein